jgi:hypothetical protein
MLSLFVLVVAVAALAMIWRYGYWPFDGRYTFLPKYGESREQKAGRAGIKPGP